LKVKLIDKVKENDLPAKPFTSYSAEDRPTVEARNAIPETPKRKACIIEEFLMPNHQTS